MKQWPAGIYDRHSLLATAYELLLSYNRSPKVSMHIHEYQDWLEKWDRARTWDRVLLSHTLLHAVEEMGEISKLVQMLEGYRPLDPPDEEAVRDLLALELSDLQVMLFKIAYLCDIDMEEAMQRGQRKADERFPDPSTGPAERDAYWQRFRQQIDALEQAPHSARGNNDP